MIKTFIKIAKFSGVSKAKTCYVVALNVIEAFFAISGIAFLYPLLKFVQLGREEFIIHLGTEMKNIGTIIEFFNIPITLLSLIALSIVPVVLGQVVKYYKTVLVIQVQQNIIYKFRKKLLSVLFKANDDLFIHFKLGHIANVLTMEALRVGYIIRYLMQFVGFVFIGIIYFFVLAGISIQLMIISVVLVPVLPVIVRKQTSVLKRMSEIITETNGHLQAFLIEKLRGIKKVRSLTKEQDEIEFFLNEAKRQERVVTKSGKIRALMESAIQPMTFIIGLMIIFVGVKFLRLDFAILALYIYIISRLSPALRGMVQTRNQISRYIGSLDNVMEIYNTALDYNKIESGEIKFSALKQGIKFQDINLKFDKEELFKNFSLEITPNTTVALIGKSGAGKSTLVDLIMRFRDVDSGAILVDNVNIKDYDLESYRSSIGFVSQEHILFYGNILDNVTYGLKNKSMDEVIEACKKAHAYEFVETFSKSFNTEIGEAGNKLSVGQKQRLSLAHIMLQDPDIIILDEPTSALDVESEKIIKNTIEELHGKKTI
ncbi:ABC transporter ATP-binding protein, partial [Elusimicrobiota bacterium]